MRPVNERHLDPGNGSRVPLGHGVPTDGARLGSRNGGLSMKSPSPARVSEFCGASSWLQAGKACHGLTHAVVETIA